MRFDISIHPDISRNSLVWVKICPIQELLQNVIKSSTKELLGEGTYGKVFAASSNVVVKQADICTSYGVSESTIKELIFLRQFSHPHIVRLLDYKISNSKLNLALERGECFWNWANKFSCVDRCKMIPMILFQLVSTLYYLDAHKLIHQDIKMHNIIVQEFANGKFTVKLIDFGSVGFPRSAQTVSLCTSSLRAPEAFLCDCKKRGYLKCLDQCGKFASSGDVYSLGVTMMDWVAKKYTLYNRDEYKNKITSRQRKWFLDGFDDTIDKCGVFSNNLGDSKLADIIKLMVKLDPKNRISIRDLYFHPYFDYLRRDIIPAFPAPSFKHNISGVLANQSEINSRKRAVAVEWIAEVMISLKDMVGITLAVSILDRYLAKINNHPINKLQLLACACICISACIINGHGNVEDMVHYSDLSCSFNDISKKIEQVLSVLDGKLWACCFDHDITDPNWKFIIPICMNVKVFSNYTDALTAYQTKLVVEPDCPITVSAFKPVAIL